MISTSKWVGLVVLLFVAGAFGCMRYSPDRVYEINTAAQITEDGADGSRVITGVTYIPFGRGPGADGLYGTGDDDIARYRRDVVGPSTRLKSVAYSDDPGPDRLWFTTDDSLINAVNYTKDDSHETWSIVAKQYELWYPVVTQILNPETHKRLYSKPEWDLYSVLPSGGYSDALAGDTDPLSPSYFYANYYYVRDGVTYTFSRRPFPNGFEVRMSVDPGPDGRAGTDDDLLERLWKISQVGSTYTVLEYAGAGIDHVWGTEDDQFINGTSLELNGVGLVTVEKHISDIGSDKIPFTLDDGYLAVIERQVVTAGTETRASVRLRGRPRNQAVADSGVLLGQLESSSTKLYVVDTQFFPGLWMGPKEVYALDAGLGDPTLLQRSFFQLKPDVGTGDAIELEVRSSLTRCGAQDLFTLEPCVTLADQSQTEPFGPVAIRTLRRLDTNTVLLDLKDGYSGGGQKIIEIDRTIK